MRNAAANRLRTVPIWHPGGASRSSSSGASHTIINRYTRKTG
jgi:hypothetical protein